MPTNIIKNMKDLKIAICLLTCELDHLEEWYIHHKNYGFKNFFVFLDNKFIKSLDKIDFNLKSEIKNINIMPTEYNGISFQEALYTYICKKYTNFDYILFIDSDEYYESKTKNVIEDINLIKQQYGNFDCLSIFWRFYGSYPPFEKRVPIESYKKFTLSPYIKCLVNPNAVKRFNNPHIPLLEKNSICIDENGTEIVEHNSENVSTANKIWIKHIFTRSKEEWRNKISRKGWYKTHHIDDPQWPRNMELFYKYNKDVEEQSKYFKI